MKRSKQTFCCLLWVLFCHVLGFTCVKGQSSCDSILQLPTPSSLSIAGTWKDPSSSFATRLVVKSAKGGIFRIRVGRLVNQASKRMLAGEKLIISDTLFNLRAGSQKSVDIQLHNMEEEGLFEGTLQLSEILKDCQWEMPIRLELYREKPLLVLESDQNQSLQMVAKSYLDFLMPGNLKRREINVRVDNLDDLSNNLDSFALALKGVNSGAVITETDVLWDRTDTRLRPLGLKNFKFALHLHHFEPDQYQGQLRLYFSHQSEPLKVSLGLYYRRGAGLALLALLLGIVLGRMVRLLNQSKEQMPLVKEYYRLAARAARLKDIVARDWLENELKELEEKVDTAKTEAALQSIHHGLTKVEAKINKINKLEVIIESIREKPDLGIVQNNSNKAALNAAHLKIRDAVLKDQPNEEKKAREELNNLVAKLKAGSRSADESTTPSLTHAELTEAINNMENTVPAVRTPTPFSEWERFLAQVLGTLTGITMSAKVRYVFLRPLVALVTFVVLLLLGFQEVYIQKGTTFGADGVFDYLELMLWGAVSDMFSQSLVGSKEVTGFLGRG